MALRSAHRLRMLSAIFALISGLCSAATLFLCISGSVFKCTWLMRMGLSGAIKRARAAALNSSVCFFLPLRLAVCCALYWGSCHFANSFSRTSGRFDGLFSPRNFSCTSGDFIRAVALARVSGLCMGLFLRKRSLVAALPSAVMPLLPSPPDRRFVSGPVPSWIRPYLWIKLRSSVCASSKLVALWISTTTLVAPIRSKVCLQSQPRAPAFSGFVRCSVRDMPT